MTNFFELFDSSRFMPHGCCYQWRPELIWLHVTSDLVIALSYYVIPFFLTYFIYKKKGQVPFNWVFIMFALFIIACGTTHVMEVVAIWRAEYALSGLIKLITAIISLITAITIVPVLSKLLKEEKVVAQKKI